MSIAHDDEQAYRYELKINQLYEERREEKKWVDDLLANTTLSGEEKIVLYVIRDIVQRVRSDMNDPVHIWIGEISNRTGLADRTIKKVTDKLHALALIIKDTRGKGKSQRCWFSIPEHVRSSSKQLVKDRRRNRGGARQRCEKCGSENLDVYVAYACRDCGHIHKYDMQHLQGKSGHIQEI